MQVAGGLGAIGAASLGGLLFWHNKSTTDTADKLVLSDSMTATFKRLYARRLAEKDEFTTALWARVQVDLVFSRIPSASPASLPFSLE